MLQRNGCRQPDDTRIVHAPMCGQGSSMHCRADEKTLDGQSVAQSLVERCEFTAGVGARCMAARSASAKRRVHARNATPDRELLAWTQCAREATPQAMTALRMARPDQRSQRIVRAESSRPHAMSESETIRRRPFGGM